MVRICGMCKGRRPLPNSTCSLLQRSHNNFSMFFSSLANSDGFDFDPMTSSGSQQPYSIPSSGGWWQSMQGHHYKLHGKWQ